MFCRDYTRARYGGAVTTTCPSQRRRAFRTCLSRPILVVLLFQNLSMVNYDRRPMMHAVLVKYSHISSCASLCLRLPRTQRVPCYCLPQTAARALLTPSPHWHLLSRRQRQ